MSIVPINNERGIVSHDNWDVAGDFFNSLDFWDPFQAVSFPSMFSTHFPSIFPSLETQLNWRQTPSSHVFRAVIPNEDVLVSIDDDNMLEIKTESGKFMSKFKLPENARRDQIQASMVNGLLTVNVPKEGAHRPNVRAIDISGSG